MAEFEFEAAARRLGMSVKNLIDLLYKENLISIVGIPYKQYVRAGLFCRHADKVTMTADGIDWVRRHMDILAKVEVNRQQIKARADQKRLAAKQQIEENDPLE